MKTRLTSKNAAFHRFSPDKLNKNKPKILFNCLVVFLSLECIVPDQFTIIFFLAVTKCEIRYSVSVTPFLPSLFLFLCFFLLNCLLYIPLTNRVQGPYCKLGTEFFPVDIWPKRFAYYIFVCGHFTFRPQPYFN